MLYLEARGMRVTEDEENTNGVVELWTKLLERLAKDLDATLTAEAIMLEPRVTGSCTKTLHYYHLLCLVFFHCYWAGPTQVMRPNTSYAAQYKRRTKPISLIPRLFLNAVVWCAAKQECENGGRSSSGVPREERGNYRLG